MDISAPVPANSAPSADLIKESSTATFQQDVIDASATTPVLVDFWAPWCGPCRQLGPAIEKIVTEFGGKLKLVKINIDENQALAGQMNVQSIPAVFAFSGGQPVDGFMGALPESEIRAFAQKVIDTAAKAGGSAADDMATQIDDALKAATNAIEAQDYTSAEQIYSMVLQHMPDNVSALIGLAQTSIKTGDTDRAAASLDMVPEDRQKLPEYLSARAALDLKKEAAALGSTAELEARLAKAPDDHQARLDLALALNADGQKLEAAETLVALMRKDREWNEDGARKKLLELFEAWGAADPATIKGRRLLSAALFA